MRILLTFTLTVLLSSLLFSCFDDEKFSSNPSLRLEFSSDTVRFDTVFTTIGTPKQTLKIYNKNKDAVTIGSVKVMNPDVSGFTITVDGSVGDEVHNIDIWGKDSAFMWVAVKVNPLNQDKPVLIRDSIQVSWNGNIHYIQLEALGQDVFIWRGKTIDKDTTLTDKKPFLIYDSLVINKGVTVNIEKNTYMYFHNAAKVKLDGTLRVVGTLEEPVVFRGDRTDWFFSNVPYDRLPGQWDGIVVDSLSFNNYFEHFHFRNSVNGIKFKHSNTSQKKAVFVNSIIHNTKEDGLSAENCKIEAYNSLFSNAAGSTVKLVGGDYYFLHCTLANWMTWISRKKGSYALMIGNATENKNAIPLERCEFINTVISGSVSHEAGLQRAEGNTTALNYKFDHCFIRGTSKDTIEGGEILVNNIWKRADVKFKTIDGKTLYYDFRLDSVSVAKDAADPSYSVISDPSLPVNMQYDMLGNSRLSDGFPDIGCYEWMPYNATFRRKDWY
ncbi:MAG: hypothetical protein ACLVKO_01310 [Dysgonomonas sp.]